MERKFDIRSPYLMIPVIEGGTARLLEFFTPEGKILEFNVPFDPENASPTWSGDFFGAVNMRPFYGRTVTVRGDFSEKFFDGIIPGDKPISPYCLRPFLHFTAETGWTNDPNGLLYDGEKFHMYFQHNPLGKPWNNMSWGHAESSDLIHWEQTEDVLYPDENGAVFSGSGLVDSRNTLGFGEGTLAFFYTAAGSANHWSEGKKLTQQLAVSTDGGRSLIREGRILPMVESENRDPKVYFHEESGHYYMALFLAEPDEFGIFISGDLRNWTETLRLYLPGLRECPDLRAVPVATAEEYTGEEAWIFTAADGGYYVGNFDGMRFTPESEFRTFYKTALPYAAQTFQNTDRVIQIPWLRTKDPAKPYTSTMGLPRELTLRRQEDGTLLLYGEEVYELNYARKTYDELFLSRREGFEPYCTYEMKEKGAVEFTLTAKGRILPSFTMNLFGTDIFYGALDHSLTVLGVRFEEGEKELLERREQGAFDPEKPTVRSVRDLGELRKLQILLDGTVLEITVDEGREVYIYDLLKERYCGTVEIEVQGDTELTVSELR